jgi:hypothetical protein
VGTDSVEQAVFEDFDETTLGELDELINGSLDAMRAAALRRQLATIPGAVDRVEAMARDRVALRCLAEPEPPADLLDNIEPLLARSLLLEAPPPPMIMRERRAPKRWPVALAAGLGIVVTAGMWAVVSGVFDGADDGPGDGAMARHDDAAEPVTPQRPEAPPAVPGVLAPPGSRHHYEPLPMPGDQTRMAIAPAPAELITPLTSPPVLEAPRLALVIQTDDRDHAADTLTTVFEPFKERTAVVRNFSYDSAMKLDEAYNLRATAERLARDNRPVMADGSPAPRPPAGIERDRAARRRALLEQARDLEAAADPGERLLGPEALEPPVQTQMDLAELGATFTVTVPGDLMQTVLGRLAGNPDLRISLVPLDGVEAPRDLERPADVWRIWAAWRGGSEASGTCLTVPVIVAGGLDG